MKTRSLAWLSTVACMLLPFVGRAAPCDFVYESATLGPTEQNGGLNIGIQCVGWRFHVESPVQVEGIGGHLLVLPLPPFNGRPIYGALVPLSGPWGFPSGNPSMMEVIASVTFTPPFPSQDVLVPLSATLTPGDYGLVFGSYRFGATGEGAMPFDNIDIPGQSSWFAWHESDQLWIDHSAEKGLRFVVTGTTVDTAPPIITGIAAIPNQLWPPNHQMVPVTVSVSATDDCAIANSRIVEIACNEATTVGGRGKTSPDWQITGDLTANLRAERSGSSKGRVYTITVQCTDTSGNISTGTVKVTVAHDKGK